MLLSQGKGHKSDWSTRVAADTIWNVAKRRYDSVKGEFVREGKVFSESKKGKLGSEELAAKQLAQATGQEQAVMDQGTGAIKVKPGTVQNFPSTPAPTPAKTPSPSVGIPSAGTPSSVNVSKLTHTKAQLDSARQLLSSAGVDTSGYTDEQLDQIVDNYIDFSEENNETEKVESKKDTEAEKTFKKLGFSE